MSDILICSKCGNEDQTLFSSNRCQKCGALITKNETGSTGAPQENKSVPIEILDKFTTYVENVYLDEGDSVDWTILLPDAEDMGIPLKVAQEIVDKVRGSINKAELNISVYFDFNRASKGVANGTSILLVKVENTSKKNIEKVELCIVHPETKESIYFPEFSNLLRGKSKQHVVEIIYSRIGQHSINEGQINVIALSGAMEVYTFGQPIMMVAENSNTTQSSTVVTNIETHGGGVVDNSNNQSQLTNTDVDSNWKKIVLARVNNRIKNTPNVVSALRNSSNTLSNIAERGDQLPGSGKSLLVSDQKDTQEIENINSLNSRINTQSQIANNVDVDQKEPSYFPKPVSINVTTSKESNKVVEVASSNPDLNTFKNTSILSLNDRIRSLESDQDYQLPFDIVYKRPDELQDLLKYYLSSFIQSLLDIFRNSEEKNNFWFAPACIDSQLLSSLNKAIEHSNSILLVAVCSHTVNSQFLSSFKEPATVVTEDGVYLLECSESKFNLLSSFNWTYLKKSNFALDEVEGCVYFGRDSKLPLPGFFTSLSSLESNKKDALLALHKSKLRLVQIYAVYEALSFKTNRASISSEIQTTKENSQGNNLLSRKLDNDVKDVMHESSVQKVSYVEDELSIAIRAFFSMLSFSSQYCDDLNPNKPIHIFGNQHDEGDLAHSIALELIHLLPNRQIIALCIDFVNTEQNGHGKLINWNGPACVVCHDGIYHIQSNGRKLSFDRTGNNYLSWETLFNELNATLLIRHEVPDIWLGTESNFFIIGTFIDFTKYLDSWVYFEQHVRKELFSRFNYFKKLVN